MKRYLSFFLSLIISLSYTVLLLFAVAGFERGNLLDKVMSDLHIANAAVFLLLIGIVCLLLNICLLLFLLKRNSQRMLNIILYGSFITGCLLIATASMPGVKTFFYHGYINLFYQGVYYEGEGKVPQLFSYIARMMTLCFFIGLILSSYLARKITRKQPVENCSPGVDIQE